jgi:steroid delta-isomerase-like uncharacterized protein
MPVEQQKTLVRHFFEEVWNQGNLAVIGQVCTPEFVLHDPATPRFKTPLDYEQLVSAYRRAFPDLHCTIEEQIAERNLVVTWWGMQGTHRGPLFGYAPTERYVRFTGITLNLIHGGQIAEARVSWDALGLFQQLGIVPNVGLAQVVAQPIGIASAFEPQMEFRPQ